MVSFKVPCDLCKETWSLDIPRAVSTQYYKSIWRRSRGSDLCGDFWHNREALYLKEQRMGTRELQMSSFLFFSVFLSLLSLKLTSEQICREKRQALVHEAPVRGSQCCPGQVRRVRLSPVKDPVHVGSPCPSCGCWRILTSSFPSSKMIASWQVRPAAARGWLPKRGLIPAPCDCGGLGKASFSPDL